MLLYIFFYTLVLLWGKKRKIWRLADLSNCFDAAAAVGCEMIDQVAGRIAAWLNIKPLDCLPDCLAPWWLTAKESSRTPFFFAWLADRDPDK